jgi:antitoxin component YwqK of YwqJK toxin-antitoxin module
MNQTVNGLKEGYWEWYHDNGKLYIKGNYISDRRDGYWEIYHSNASLEIQEIYI